MLVPSKNSNEFENHGFRGEEKPRTRKKKERNRAVLHHDGAFKNRIPCPVRTDGSTPSRAPTPSCGAARCLEEMKLTKAPHRQGLERTRRRLARGAWLGAEGARDGRRAMGEGEARNFR